VVTKNADALEISLDFLTGKTAILMDKQILNRIEDIEKLPYDKKNISSTSLICASGILKPNKLTLYKKPPLHNEVAVFYKE